MDYKKLIAQVEERIAQLEQFTSDSSSQEEWNELINIRNSLHRLLKIVAKRG